MVSRKVRGGHAKSAKCDARLCALSETLAPLAGNNLFVGNSFPQSPRRTREVRQA